MSNSAVGNVYQSVIDEVINNSRVDFEENGVEEAVLEELRQGWQEKLTQLGVARFPWDPKPVEPTPPPPAPVQQQQQQQQQPPVQQSHSQATFSPQIPLPNVAIPQQQQQQPQAPHNGIKTEPGYDTNGSNDPVIKQEPGTAPNYAASGSTTAVSRAQQHLNAMYGQRAAGSINALSGGQPQGQQQGQYQQQQQQQRPQVPQIPQQGQQYPQQQQQQQQQAPQTAQRAPPPAHPTPALSQEQYRQQLAQQMAQQQNSHLNKNQTDGAGDSEEDREDDEFDAILVRRSKAGELETMGRLEIDDLLHRQIAARAKAMEGGGLMIPLKEATRHRSAGGSSSEAAPSSQRREGRGIAAHDGGDDDDEDDEDAINSDLDDPEDEEGEDDEADEGMGSIMLCMYDKVQRVKNKWKCTLKDGVLTVNGQDYVFHKATGEFEW